MSGFSVPATDTAHPKNQDDGFEWLSQTSSDEQSAISTFPCDVLSLIFRYTYDPIPPFDGRYRSPDSTTISLVQALGLVSKHWYRALMETSEFWTNINMSMEGTDTSKYATGLVSFFEKTRYRSLSLSLDFSGLDVDDNILLDPSADAIISKNLERIENLQLVKPPLAWFCHLHHLNRIDHLSLYQLRANPIHLSFDRIPSLSKFTLVNSNVRLANSFLGITSLTLIGVPLDTCFNLVINCPKLKRLHLEDYVTSGQYMLDDNAPISEISAGLQQPLEVIIWKIFSTQQYVAPWQTALLHHLNTNSLQTLTWHQPPHWSLQSPSGQELRIAISTFFARLSQRLTCIEFIENYDSTWRTETRFIEHMRNDQGVHSLKFSECNTGFIMSIFEKLTDSPTRFPQLDTITIGRIVWSNPRNVNVDKRLEEMISERFLEMVKSRLKPMDGRLALCMEDDSLYRAEDGSNSAWLDYIKQDVMELTSCGYQIDIFIASKLE
ncbi:hypothetical protein AGABI1DRAFT_124693 [Agaricus bisporus var. burnettii JB137-S8]|uniref:F-box domain-containing protein n=1 Tax=Agaricus bisporus var. burnettii (strain JB137-S8 / ATCC MYA-4627 / FGSC 10392) TaxID=597362 RepID=K5X8W7_AGABU|nr:uncharacterized protein AGABI1DRAFT_124693 [Agaricus bisporus var. burnettii JB137-S8]EKM84381.1 hypothetical protein AGABI1DRAFT_124693 [Agaricus bisporus var. burnettii JB137-S8]